MVALRPQQLPTEITATIATVDRTAIVARPTVAEEARITVTTETQQLRAPWAEELQRNPLLWQRQDEADAEKQSEERIKRSQQGKESRKK